MTTPESINTPEQTSTPERTNAPGTDSANRFPAGAFAPAPRPAPITTILTAQAWLELKLLLRNGEQLLLTMFIPITVLPGRCLLPVDAGLGATVGERAHVMVPAIMTVAIMSTAFTGQAIAVGFDRRYGALKRLGATPIPRWGIIAGKAIAVALVVALQAVILGGIGLALGWRPDIAGLALGAVIIMVGTVTFAALGLLLGGTLKAEVVLALANLLWFVLIGIGSLTIVDSGVPETVRLAARCVPSGALTEALSRAASGGFDAFGICVLLIWAAVAAALAVRWFKFE